MNKLDSKLRTKFQLTSRSPSTDIALREEEPPTFLGRYKAPKLNRRCISLPSINESSRDTVEPLYIQIHGQDHQLNFSNLNRSFSIRRVGKIDTMSHSKQPWFTPSQIFRAQRSQMSTSIAGECGSEVGAPLVATTGKLNDGEVPVRDDRSSFHSRPGARGQPRGLKRLWYKTVERVIDWAERVHLLRRRDRRD